MEMNMAAKVAMKVIEQTEPKPPYQPTEPEAGAVKEHVRRLKTRVKPPTVKIAVTKGNTVRVEPTHPNPTIWQVGFEQAFGTTSGCFADLMLNTLLKTTLRDASDIDEHAVNGMLAAMHGIDPADEVETMLA